MLDAVARRDRADGDLVLMVKPQFEVGKERVGKGGVVREPELRAEAVQARGRGGRRGVAGAPRWWPSARCPGPSGNVEFFLWLRQGPAAVDAATSRRGVGCGPAGGAG